MDAGSWATRLAPPAGLVPRIRWAFLLANLFLLGTFAVRAVVASTKPEPLRALCVVLLLVLAAWWVRGYRRGTFPAWAVPLELAALVVLVLVQDAPISVVTSAYFAVQFRSLYDGWRETVLFGVSTAVTFVVATRAVSVTGWVDEPPLSLTVFASVPLLMVVMHLVALAGHQTERGAARERLLSRSGLAAARAAGADAAREVALAATRELLAAEQHHEVHLRRAGERSVAPAGSCVVDLPVPVAQGYDEVLRVTSAHPLRPEVGDALLVVATQLSSALTNAALTADLEHRAGHDPLTGLVNRRRLDEELEAAVAQRRPPGGLALLTLDLDGFKAVNDAHGHAVGDELLVAVARRLLTHVRAGDTVARTGGDEFVVLVVGELADDRARDLADRLLAAVGAPFAVDGRELRVGVSIGTAVHAGGSARHLLRLSDQAMYESKGAGRHRAVHLGAPQEAVAP